VAVSHLWKRTQEERRGRRARAHVRNVLCISSYKPPRKTPKRPSQIKMILTNCAACAAPLAHNAPRCVRCHTRYCNATCQHDHWRRGHKQICKRIHRGGNAEQYYADKKYKEAVAEAVEACADDTKGQTYANSLNALQRFEEAKALLNKSLPVARRVLGESHHLTLYMQLNNARALYMNTDATLDDLHEAATTLEDAERTSRRVLGGAHPLTKNIERSLKVARFTLASFDAP